MDGSDACLGLCFADHQLFYAVNDPGRKGHLNHIGCIEFSYPIEQAVSLDSGGFNASIRTTLANLGKKYNCRSVRLLSPAHHECWSVCPRLVYDTPDEREDHLSILMDNTPRNQLESTWYDISNINYKLLLVRDKKKVSDYRKLLSGFSDSDFVSEFEIGSEWHTFTGLKGAYLTINCHSSYIAISSFLLGKLRGATYIDFDDLSDLPYLWNFYGAHLTWMNGIHDEVYFYGKRGLEVSDIMSVFFNDTGDVMVMNSLDNMHVHAEETTYGFNLETAFPAVLLSLNNQSTDK